MLIPATSILHFSWKNIPIPIKGVILSTLNHNSLQNRIVNHSNELCVRFKAKTALGLGSILEYKVSRDRTASYYV